MRPRMAGLDELGAAIRHHGVTTLWLTAGLFNLMVEQRLDDLRSLRQQLAGGMFSRRRTCSRHTMSSETARSSTRISAARKIINNLTVVVASSEGETDSSAAKPGDRNWFAIQGSLSQDRVVAPLLEANHDFIWSHRDHPRGRDEEAV
jgi:hypothetical protein